MQTDEGSDDFGARTPLDASRWHNPRLRRAYRRGRINRHQERLTRDSAQALLSLRRLANHQPLLPQESPAARAILPYLRAARNDRELAWILNEEHNRWFTPPRDVGYWAVENSVWFSVAALSLARRGHGAPREERDGVPPEQAPAG